MYAYLYEPVYACMWFCESAECVEWPTWSAPEGLIERIGAVVWALICCSCMLGRNIACTTCKWILFLRTRNQIWHYLRKSQDACVVECVRVRSGVRVREGVCACVYLNNHVVGSLDVGRLAIDSKMRVGWIRRLQPVCILDFGAWHGFNRSDLRARVAKQP